MVIAKLIRSFLTPIPFDPDAYRLPLPQSKRQLKPPTKSLPEGLTTWGKSAQSAILSVEKFTDDEPLAPTWTKITTTSDITNRQRIADITDLDRQLLDEYADKYPNLNLTIEKLIVVKKDFWIHKVPRDKAVAHMKQKKERGFSDKVVKTLYAICNASLVEAEMKEKPPTDRAIKAF